MTVPIRPIASGYQRVISATENLGLTTAADPRSLTRVIVVTSPSSDASVLDAINTTPTATNVILTIPAGAPQGTVYEVGAPCNAGLAIVIVDGKFTMVWQ